MRTILYALLSQKAIHDGLSVQLWVYTLAKSLDAQVGGRGWVRLEDLERLYPRSRRNLQRIIKAGRGLFWRVDKRAGRLYLRSTAHLGIQLGTTLGDPIYVDTEQISTLQRFRAHCYSAFYAQPKTISRGRLCTLYGVTKQTLSKWEKLANIRKTTNLGEKQIRAKEDLKGIPDGHEGGVWFWRGFVYWQIPNTFHLDSADLAPRHVRQNRAIRQALKAEWASAQRLYFDRRDRASLRVLRGEQPFAYVRTGKRLGTHRVWGYLHA